MDPHGDSEGVGEADPESEIVETPQAVLSVAQSEELDDHHMEQGVGKISVGYAPATKKKKAGKLKRQARALRNFSRQQQPGGTPFLTIKKGDIVNVLKEAERGWVLVSMGKTKGYVPDVCIELLPVSVPDGGSGISSPVGSPLPPSALSSGPPIPSSSSFPVPSPASFTIPSAASFSNPSSSSSSSLSGTPPSGSPAADHHHHHHSPTPVSPTPATISPASPTPSGLSIALAKVRASASPAATQSSSSSSSSLPLSFPPMSPTPSAPSAAAPAASSQPAPTPRGSKKPVAYAKANRDFDRQQVGATPYLKIKKGEVVAILKKAERGWWLAVSGGKTGYVPQVCVDEVPEPQEDGAPLSPPPGPPPVAVAGSAPAVSTLSGGTPSSSPVRPIVVSLANSGPRPVQNSFQLTIPPVSSPPIESPPPPPPAPEPSSPIPPPPGSSSSSSSFNVPASPIPPPPATVSSPLPPPSSGLQPFPPAADEDEQKESEGKEKGSDLGEPGAPPALTPSVSASASAPAPTVSAPTPAASAPAPAASAPAPAVSAPPEEHPPADIGKEDSPVPAEHHEPMQVFPQPPTLSSSSASSASSASAAPPTQAKPSDSQDSRKREISKSMMVTKPNQVYTQQYTQQLFQQEAKDATEIGEDASVDRYRIEKLIKLELGPQGLRYRVLYRGVDGRAYVGWKPSTYFTQHCASALAAFAEFASHHPTGFH